MWRLLAVVVITGTGCAGVKTNLVHDSLRYPVSMSASLPDAYGNLHVIGHSLGDVGAINESLTIFGVLYGLQRRDVDIGAVLNKRIEKLGGQGAVQVAVSEQTCIVNFVFPLNVLPFWPGCVDVHITGRVVRLGGLNSPDVVAAKTDKPHGTSHGEPPVVPVSVAASLIVRNECVDPRDSGAPSGNIALDFGTSWLSLSNKQLHYYDCPDGALARLTALK
jgi:hypothetical protein